MLHFFENNSFCVYFFPIIFNFLMSIKLMIINEKRSNEFSDFNLPPIISSPVLIYFKNFLHAYIRPFILKSALPQYF